MKITLDRDRLLPALGRAARIIERRSTIPVLANLLMTAEDGRLRLRATDLDIDIDEAIAAEVTDAGTVTAPGHMLHDIARKLPDGCQVTLEATGPHMALKAGRSRFRIPTLPAEDWPNIALGALPHAFDLKATDLATLIERAQFAVSTEETRYYLNGIFLHRTADGALRGVATDGHRLARVTLAEGTGVDGMPGVILPRKTVAEVARLLGDAPGSVSIALSEQKVRFGIGEIVLTSKLIDGTFPDYERVVPAGNSRRIVAERAQLVAALDRVLTLASERGRAVKFTFAERLLTLTVTNPEAGEAVEELTVDYEGEELTIGFNGRYLLDILAQIDGDTVALNLESPGDPALIEDAVASGALFVLMPMRV